MRRDIALAQGNLKTIICLLFCSQGYCVVATPLPFSLFDHEAGAADIAGQYRGAESVLRDIYGREVIEEVGRAGERGR